MLLRAAFKALMWTVAALILGGVALGTLTSPGVAAMAAPLVCASGQSLVPVAEMAPLADGDAEPPAYACRGAGENSSVTMTALIIAVAKVLAPAIVIVIWPLLTWWYYRRAVRRRRFILEGTPATARIVSAQPTLRSYRSDRIWEFELELAGPSVAVRNLTHREALPNAFHAALQPGVTIPALVDPADPRKYVVLFEHVPLADPRDPAIPGTIEPQRALRLLRNSYLISIDEAAARRARLGASE